MADEAAASVVPSLGKLTYSLKQYLTYARLLQEKASRLNRGGQHHTLTVLPYTVESLIEDTSQWTLRRTLFCVEEASVLSMVPLLGGSTVVTKCLTPTFDTIKLHLQV